MNLLKPSQITKIKSAIKDTTDTFFTRLIEVVKYSERVPLFNESKSTNYDPNIFPVKALVVYHTDKEDVERNIGQQDKTIGEVTIHWEDAQAAGLISGDKLLIEGGVDELQFDGKRWQILRPEKVGPLQSEYLLVKIIFEEKVNPKQA